MRIVFVTNPYNAESYLALEELLQAGQEVVALITPRERRKGKGPFGALLRLVESRGFGGAMKEAGGMLRWRFRARLSWRPPGCAEEVVSKNGVPILRPRRLEDSGLAERVKDLRGDLLVVCFCTQRLPKSLLQAARLGAVNVHRSLLPAYGGPRPVFWALYQRETETGVSVHRLVEELDAGEVLAQEKIAINPGDTEVSLNKKLVPIGARLLRQVVCALERGEDLAPVRPSAEKSYFGRPTRRQVGELKQRQKARAG